MIKIATLGPAGTYTELAAKRYIKDRNIDGEIKLYPTIQKSFMAIGNECELGIIPIENTIDGYVQLSLDLLLRTDLKIINEIILPIHFTFVGNSPDISEIEKVYVQFKTHGQCLNFLEQFSNEQIILSESNSKSYNLIKKGIQNEGAVVPNHSISTDDKFPLVIKDITDYSENKTRFIILAKESANYNSSINYKTSLIIVDAADEPGILSKILNEFSKRGINLKSIMSRPTKRVLGKYHFFIDIEGHYSQDELVKESIDEISIKNVVKVLGSYSVI